MRQFVNIEVLTARLPPLWIIGLAVAGVLLAVLVASGSRRRRPKCRAVPILNRGEDRLFRQLLEFCREEAFELTVAPQVSYGAFLKTQRPDDWRAIAFKRADFVLFGPDNIARLVVEFDGAGHWGSSRDSAKRANRTDAVKDYACGSAGLPMIRVSQRMRRAEIDDRLRAALGTDRSTEGDKRTA